jgi:hypothetical protein
MDQSLLLERLSQISMRRPAGAGLSFERVEVSKGYLNLKLAEWNVPSFKPTTSRFADQAGVVSRIWRTSSRRADDFTGVVESVSV